MNDIHLSVITATRNRPKHLARVLQSFREQDHFLNVEHIVVSDGPDEPTKLLANHYDAVFLHPKEPLGLWGAGAKDMGITAARGEYVVFWDDDNTYYRNCLSVLYGISYGFDIGVAQCDLLDLIGGVFRTLPAHWTGSFSYGEIDTMCICVRRTVAERSKWYDGRSEPGTDFRWLSRIVASPKSIHFAPVVIGKHPACNGS